MDEEAVTALAIEVAKHDDQFSDMRQWPSTNALALRSNLET